VLEDLFDYFLIILLNNIYFEPIVFKWIADIAMMNEAFYSVVIY